MIKLFLSDSDGVLTDGGYYVFSDARTVVKRYHTRDFYGMELLQKAGINVGVITSALTGTEEEQCKRAGRSILCLTGIMDKYGCVQDRFVRTSNYKWDEIAYIGDDLNDRELLTAVGMAACPMDAEIEIVELIRNRPDGYVIGCSGGHGCVRRFASIVLKLVEESYNKSIRRDQNDWIDKTSS